jgi:endonuclease YncB( thermonuclease family)
MIVDRGTRVFWVLIVVLLGASMFFGLNVQQRRAALKPVQELTSGEIVAVTSIVDGDTVVVKSEAGMRATVRIVGIKTFDATQKGDDAARFGALAVDALRRLTENQPVRAVLATPPRDRHGRTLAHLYVGEIDLGLELVKSGLALTYSVYPFPSMSLYAEAQAHAHGDRHGLWADPKLAQRAELLERQWRGERP